MNAKFGTGAEQGGGNRETDPSFSIEQTKRQNQNVERKQNEIERGVYQLRWNETGLIYPTSSQKSVIDKNVA